MKQIKKVMAVLTSLVLCAAFVLATPITARAAEPVKYWLKNVSGEWRYQTGSWKDDGDHRELYYMQQVIKDGDIIVVEGDTDLKLEVNVKLQNLTIVKCPAAVISTKGVDEVYVLNDSVLALTGDVAKAEVHDYGVANFNSNVKELRVMRESESLLAAKVGVLGTVEHLYAASKAGLHYEGYNFEAGSLMIDGGNLKTDVAKYSKTPVASSATPAAPSTGTASGELDEVPKTADVRFNPLWLAAIGVVCLAGAYALKREK